MYTLTRIKAKRRENGRGKDKRDNLDYLLYLLLLGPLTKGLEIHDSETSEEPQS